uniref:WD repeat-containing protein 63 n=1 Tax=Panagrolaimus sp. JU765 TaxID=591449 RepID=A0AC34RB30_9BILA
MITTHQIIVVPKIQKPNVSYSKTTQTEIGNDFREKFDVEFGNKEDEDSDDDSWKSPTSWPIIDDKNETKTEIVPELSENEKEQILKSDEFLSFFSQASRVLLRELAEIENDTTINYSLDHPSLQKFSEPIFFNRVFFNPKFPGFAVSTLDFSSIHPELLVVAYTGLSKTSPGLMQVWNTKFKTTFPEVTLTTTTPISVIKFLPDRPNIIVGGLQNGQLCVWDIQSHLKSPIQKSTISTKSHTYPIVMERFVRGI